MFKKQDLFFYIIFLFFGFLSFNLLKGYGAPIYLAFLTSIIIEPIYLKLKNKFSKNIATFLSLMLVFLVLAFPISYIVSETVEQGTKFSVEIQKYFKQNEFNSFKERLQDLNTTYLRGTSLLDEPINNIDKTISGSLDNVINGLTKVGTGSFSILFKVLMYLLMLAFFIPNHRKFIKKVTKILPLDKKDSRRLVNSGILISVAMLKGTFLVALIQAVLTGILMFILGVPYVLLLTILMTFLGFIPLVGTAFVAVPVGINMIINDQVTAGIILILYSLIFVSNIDNVLRVKFFPSDVNLNPILSFLSLIGGIKVYSFMGFIYGPLIVVIFMELLDMYIDKTESENKRIPSK